MIGEIPPAPLLETEKIPEFKYPFLELLFKDHPDLAVRVGGSIEEWKKWIAQDTKSSIIADAILDAIDYVSFQEIEELISGWVEEVSAELTSKPDRLAIFILDAGGSGSQKYFGQRVYDQLPPELQKRIELLGGDEMIKRLYLAPEDFDSFIKTDYWRFDDSANSGRQLTSMVLPDFAEMSEKLKKHVELNGRKEEYLNFTKNKEAHPVFHIRFMRTTSYAEKQIQDISARLLNNEENETPVGISFDLKASKQFPTIIEVTEPLEVPWEKGKTGPSYLYMQNHVVGHPVLGFFATKIQDNLPAALVRGKLSPEGLEPLFQRVDIKPPWGSRF
jgi:hypothetical protein